MTALGSFTLRNNLAGDEPDTLRVFQAHAKAWLQQIPSSFKQPNLA